MILDPNEELVVYTVHVHVFLSNEAQITLRYYIV